MILERPWPWAPTRNSRCEHRNGAELDLSNVGSLTWADRKHVDRPRREAHFCSRLLRPYSSEIQQPVRTKAALDTRRHASGLHCLIATRTVPLVCIQMAGRAGPLWAAQRQRCGPMYR